MKLYFDITEKLASRIEDAYTRATKVVIVSALGSCQLGGFQLTSHNNFQFTNDLITTFPCSLFQQIDDLQLRVLAYDGVGKGFIKKYCKVRSDNRYQFWHQSPHKSA